MYHAPLKDLRFAIHHLLDDSQLANLKGYEEYSQEYADSVLEEAASFAEGVLAPLNAIGDQVGVKWTADGVLPPREFKVAYQKFREAGWSTLRPAVAIGGQGAPAMLGSAVEEIWSSSNLAFKLVTMLTTGAIEAIARCGSDGQKARFLPKMVSGEWSGTMNLTESQAGSDLGAIRTRAVRDGERYRIFGEKIFITYGDHDFTDNIVHLVLARVEGAPTGTRGISMFIVPKWVVDAAGAIGARNDVSCSAVERKLGIHASPTCVMTYGAGEGAIGELVGEENHGLEYMFVMMNAARLSVGLEGYSVAERAYQQALEWARTRVQGRPAGWKGDGPAPIIGHADVKRMLLSMRASIDAARSITLYTALQLDLAGHHSDANVRARAQSRADLMIPIVKGCSTEMGVAVASTGVQIHGGMGFVEDTGAAQFYRDVRITTIYEGTTGIQAIDLVGRKVSRDGGAAMAQLIADMTSDTNGAMRPGSEQDVIDVLAAIEALEQATKVILELAARGGQYVQAVAVPYLHLAGLTVGAWMMLRASVAAARLREEDAEFHDAKLQECRFYFRQLLPQVFGLVRIVESGANCVIEADWN